MLLIVVRFIDVVFKLCEVHCEEHLSSGIAAMVDHRAIVQQARLLVAEVLLVFFRPEAVSEIFARRPSLGLVLSDCRF
jgi:hypothetical protein